MSTIDVCIFVYSIPLKKSNRYITSLLSSIGPTLGIYGCNSLTHGLFDKDLTAQIITRTFPC